MQFDARATGQASLGLALYRPGARAFVWPCPARDQTTKKELEKLRSDPGRVGPSYEESKH
jgi:hypothetical protein